jgi:hypothetical protein
MKGKEVKRVVDEGKISQTSGIQQTSHIAEISATKKSQAQGSTSCIKSPDGGKFSAKAEHFSAKLPCRQSVTRRNEI